MFWSINHCVSPELVCSLSSVHSNAKVLILQCSHVSCHWYSFSHLQMQPGGNKSRWNWLNVEKFVWFWWKWRRKIVSWCLEEKRRRKYCQLMFGSFLVPSSTVVADESQERTKTSLTNLLESPKETTWCQDDKNMTKPALDIFGWTWFTRWRSKVQMYGSALLLLCLCVVRPHLCTTEDWNIGFDPETKTRQPSLLKLQSRTRTVPWKSNTSTTKKNTYMWDV